MDTIEEKFAGMENYAQFETFLQSGELSPSELEGLLAVVSNSRQARKIQKGTLPVDRESYVLFANRFGIPVSTAEMQEEASEAHQEGVEKFKGIADGLRGIPAGISVDLDTFRTMLQEMEEIDPNSAEFRTQRNTIQEFLLGANLDANK